ncbi:MAG: L-arabinose ABC transporter permease AraH [Alphaproteobacteria bacterium]
MNIQNSSKAQQNMQALWNQAGMILVLIILFIICSLFVDSFFTLRNMKGLALSISLTGMIACPMLFCLALGQLDLSVGSVVACSGVAAAVVMKMTSSIALGIGGGIAVGILAGLVNGYAIAYLRLNALIATLAMLQIVRGLAYIIANGKAVGIIEPRFFVLGTSSLLYIPVPVWITFITMLIYTFLLNKTSFGRNVLAIGGNEEAARLAGVPVERVKMWVYILTSVTTAIAGVILASRMTSGQPMTAQGLELTVISACVLGGVSLTGGIGKISYIIAGVLILGIVENAMNLIGINPFYQYVARGSILMIAVILDTYKQKSVKD